MSIGDIICTAIIALAVLFLVKNVVTLHQFTKINNAIFCYNTNLSTSSYWQNRIDYGCTKPYVVVLLKFWDWGYKHILPKDKYELVKNYIN